MKDLRGTYVHRGDAIRRRQRVRAVLLMAGLVAAGDLTIRNFQPTQLNAEGVGSSRALATALDAAPIERSVRSEMRVAGAKIERLNHILNYARKYDITSDLSAAIYDVARAEGIDPALAFPLVRLESRFEERATSPVGAVGLTQLMLGTARAYAPEVTREELYDRHVNLRIGFRYLRDLIKQYRSVQLALLVYNRGPSAVTASQQQGLDPSNGYDRIVLRGYTGTGLAR
jgi:soluble lytic murein transglycosylase-like protein